MTVDPELLQIFRDESGERLDRLESNLLAVEAGRAGPDVIDSLFRDAHSIKGNAGMVGFGEVSQVAHAMEDLLDGARNTGRLSPALVDPMLEAADAIRRGVAGESGLAAAALERLASAALPGAPALVADAGAPDVPTRPAGAGSSGRRSMRVATDKIDRLLELVGETVLQQRRLEHVVGNGSGSGELVAEELHRGDVLLDDLQESVLRMRTLPLGSITGPFPRAVRDLAVEQGKLAELTVTGDETQLDRMILDGVSETISHLLRNAVTHGIEEPEDRERSGKPRCGRIELRAEQRHGMVAVEVADDGRGVAAELLGAVAGADLTGVLSAPGFSTAGEVTEHAGRGVGLDAVNSHVQSLGGTLQIFSEPGAGTRVQMLLPLTLALLRALLVERGGQPFAIPLGAVQEAVVVTAKSSLGGKAWIELRGSTVPVIDLADLVGSAGAPLADGSPAVVVSSPAARVAVRCDRLLGEQEVVLKTLGLLRGVSGYLGAAILGDGKIALVLDPAYLTRARARGRIAAASPEHPVQAPRILVVDDQFTVRELQRSILEAAGYEVSLARDGAEALEAIEREPEIALVVTDLEMPGVDGFAMLESIRADERHRSLPVVIVTSASSEEQRRRGAQLGADAYIVKQGFDQRALLDTVAGLLGR